MFFKRDKEKEKELKNVSFKEEDYKDLTREEVEALVASRSAYLRDREKKLLKDQEEERKKDEKAKKREEKAKKVRRYLGFAAIILFILLLVARCSVLPVPEQKPEEIPINLEFEDTINTDELIWDDEEGEDFEPYSNLAMAMNVRPIFENGLEKGELIIQNDKRNVYALFVEIYLNEDVTDPNSVPTTLVYRSGLIDIGQTLVEDTLDVNLPAGTYYGTAYFNAVRIERDDNGKVTGQYLCGAGGENLKITVLNTKGTPVEID